jgi:sugar phosphate isomerase/epimerase
MHYPLSYCTNVHPCRSRNDLERIITQEARSVQEQCGFSIGVGLWLPEVVISEVAQDATVTRSIASLLADQGLQCFSLNAFPFGDFHSERVKENVYLPDWSDIRRLDYTRLCSEFLAGVLTGEDEGSVSTLPLAYKQAVQSPDFSKRAIDQLVQLSRDLDRLHHETGKTIRLAIEPEPFCLLETTPETIHFFEMLWDAADKAGVGELVRQHIGVCYDVCHQAVEFENSSVAISELAAADIRINKVQISCAIELNKPSDEKARQALAAFAEQRYLHQTFARHSDGRVISHTDLSQELALDPPPDWKQAEKWRVHFHVPVDADRLGPLGTTRPELIRALHALGQLPYEPHLEVETYTWPVLPGVESGDVIAGMSCELIATRDLLVGE